MTKELHYKLAPIIFFAAGKYSPFFIKRSDLLTATREPS